MGKFPFKRPRIISKKFPQVDSTIDGVTKSLNDLVFSYSETVDRALQKKHWMMAISSIIFLVVVGSFISPKGKAESSIFYPETCLGGWVNPQHVEGELKTTSNADDTQFTSDNSAILPKNTNAEMYCGNFKGKFDNTTKPTKIIVSLAMTNKSDEVLSKEVLESIVSTSTLETITEVASTTTLPVLASTTESLTVSSSSESVEPGNESATSSTGASTTNESVLITETATTTVDTAQALESNPQEQTPSIVTGIVESLKDTINDLFKASPAPSAETDTVIVQPPVIENEAPNPSPSPEESVPTSYNIQSEKGVFSYFIQRVVAQELPTVPPVEATPEPPTPEKQLEPGSEVPAPTETTQPSTGVSSSTENSNPSVESVETPLEPKMDSIIPISDIVESATTSSSSLSSASSTDSASSSTLILTASTTDPSSGTSTDSATTTDNQFQNNFLEILYTFDGIVWNSLGQLNEVSMKYRMFEIPVTASTSWSDLSKLQIKVVAKKNVEDTPTVFFDGIKVEVLYENVVTHVHPDFTRDTILKDEIIDGVRIVTIINSETKEKEVWYMYLDGLTDDTKSATLATSTEGTTTALALISEASTTVATATPVIDLLKHVWKKYLGKDLDVSSSDLLASIKQQEEEQFIDQIDTPPNFASDTIKMIKGVLSDTALVQIERTSRGSLKDELWIYDLEKDSLERIGVSTTTRSTIAPDFPVGSKGGYIFWVSADKEKVFAYHLRDKGLYEKVIPLYDVTQGERAEVVFEAIPWKVIINAEGFSFYSETTGEVFSDEDSSSAEQLRRIFKLDAVLDPEELSSFNLSVPSSVSTTTP